MDVDGYDKDDDVKSTTKNVFERMYQVLSFSLSSLFLLICMLLFC